MTGITWLAAVGVAVGVATVLAMLFSKRREPPSTRSLDDVF